MDVYIIYSSDEERKSKRLCFHVSCLVFSGLGRKRKVVQCTALFLSVPDECWPFYNNTNCSVHAKQ